MLTLATARQPLRVVNDQVCTPPFVPHVATAMLGLLAADAQGLFNLPTLEQHPGMAWLKHCLPRRESPPT